jgi:hypothetical protein
MSNANDYEKVMRVLTRTRNLAASLIESMGTQAGKGTRQVDVIRLMSTMAAPCEQYWNDEFGKGDGAPTSDPLDLNGADLSGQFFVWGSSRPGFPLVGANLQGARLHDTKWWWASLWNADLSKASLRGSQMWNVFIGKTLFRDADLSDSVLNLFGLIDEDEDEVAADFTSANLCGVKFVITFEFGKLILTDARVERCSVSGSSDGQPENDRYLWQCAEEVLASFSSEQRSAISVNLPPAPSPVACFIATAACGTDKAEEVRRLREFRDGVLVHHGLGRGFIQLYTVLSPPLARFIAVSPLARTLTGALLVSPAVRLVDALSYRTGQSRLSLPGVEDSECRQAQPFDSQDGG